MLVENKAMAGVIYQLLEKSKGNSIYMCDELRQDGYCQVSLVFFKRITKNCDWLLGN